MRPSPLRTAVPEPAAETARLSKVSFGYGDGPRVLTDVNLILPKGSFHFLTGPSGAGKSSLLNLLTAKASASAGEVRLFGQPVDARNRRAGPMLRRRMGLVFQDFRLLDHLDVFQNAALKPRLMGMNEAEYRSDVEEMLAWVGLSRRVDARPPELSGGEKQRLAIARAVMGRPELILADEPTGSVDAAMAARLLGLFQSLNRLGTTVLIASHDEGLAQRSGATVLRLSGGRLERAA